MILMNGLNIDPQSIPELIDRDATTAWNEAIKMAISEWYNDEDHIIMHTSGSTGTPKPIKLLKKDIEASAKLTLKTFNLKKGDHIVCCLPLHYIAGRMMLYRGIIGELEIRMIEPSANPLKNINNQVDLISLTPMQWENGLNNDPDSFFYVNKILVGGAPISNSLEERHAEHNTEIYASYGMTETLTHVALRRVGYGQAFIALDQVSFEQKIDGCLRVNTPHLQIGHVETTDLVDLIDDRRFVWLGRKDRIINVGGIKVYSEKIENEISAMISDLYFIHKRLDQTAGERPVLIIEGEKWDMAKIAQFQDSLKGRLDKYEIPVEIYFVPIFSRTHTGKVDRNKTLADIVGFIPKTF